MPKIIANEIKVVTDDWFIQDETTNTSTQLVRRTLSVAIGMLAGSFCVVLGIMVLIVGSPIYLAQQFIARLSASE